MVPKENGFNQSETPSCCALAHIVTFLGSSAMARDSEVLQRQHFCHHGYTICLPSQVT